jgi:hypothetical protein
MLSLPIEGESRMGALLASLWCTALGSLDPVEPSCCPYCSDRPARHWTKWAFYSRYAQNASEKIDVQRYRCRFAKRTFSLLPDGLLPYHYARTASILADLHAMFVEHHPTSTWARLKGAARTTLRRLKAGAALVLARLRLPGHDGALAPDAFVKHLLAFGVEKIAAIFRAWKQLEPKHSIVGFYPR